MNTETQNSYFAINDKVNLCRKCCVGACTEKAPTTAEQLTNGIIFNTQVNKIVYIHIRFFGKTFYPCQFCKSGTCNETTCESNPFTKFSQKTGKNFLHFGMNLVKYFSNPIVEQPVQKVKSVTIPIQSTATTTTSWVERAPVSAPPKSTLTDLQTRRQLLLRQSEELARLIKEEEEQEKIRLEAQTRQIERQQEIEFNELLEKVKSWDAASQAKLLEALCPVKDDNVEQKQIIEVAEFEDKQPLDTEEVDWTA